MQKIYMYKFMKQLLTILLLAVCTVAAWAVPAHPGVMKIQQPDGSYVTIRLVGDEWRSFHTTSDGYSVVKDARGFYVYARLQDGQLHATDQVAHDADERSDQEQAFLADVKKYQAPDMNPRMSQMKTLVENRETSKRSSRRAAQYDYNNFRGLVILVDFEDRSFSREDYRDLMDGMINKENYDGYVDANGTKQKFTGSVRDYFSDNSGGNFQPQFDVYGPYTIGFSQYSANGTSDADQLLLAALDSADVDINFADYDLDKDGTVDMVYFIFAGQGSNYSGNDDRLIWPHRSFIYDWSKRRYVRKDNVRFYDYACSTELMGWSSRPASVKINGIGTICHEFGHVLGLPDFYDTDYEENGQSVDPGIWSVMSGGSYENDARTPVGYSLFERVLVGFTDEPPTISGPGHYALPPVSSDLTGFAIESMDENETFLLENRQKDWFKWDAYLPGSGMLVYRIDISNEGVWNSNRINAYADHNYYEIVRAGGKTANHVDTAWDLFPGTGKVTVLNNVTSPANLKTWSGKDTKWGLLNIRLSGANVTFDVEDAMTLTSLTLPETIDLGVGMSQVLKVETVPESAEYTLTWTSSDSKVATVDEDGRVTGVGEGSCIITATSDNGCTATCLVNVIQLDLLDIFTFKSLDTDEEGMLLFDDAEVLYVTGARAYIRDVTGAIILDGVSNLGLKVNNRLNGAVLFRRSSENKMPLAIPAADANFDAFEVTEGSDVEPREVALGDLTEDDYGDYVMVRAAQLKADGGVWAVSGAQRARLWNKFNIKNIKLSNYDGKYFDIPAIYGTDVLNDTVIDELYMLATPKQVSPPSAISSPVVQPSVNAPVYNLHGQRVNSSWKGIVLQNGKKYVR